jgi:rubrerythrin
MGSTRENLQEAFVGESQANRRYLFFAEKADESGHKQIARLFRAAAEVETVHARSHLKVLGEIKSDKENLEAAVSCPCNIRGLCCQCILLHPTGQ